MDTKKTIIAGVVVVVLVIAGYLVFGKSTPAPVADQTQNQPAVDANGQPQVQGQDVTVGTGAQAIPGSVVSVLYEGKLKDGTVFDSSAAHGNQALTFTLGEQGMILGFQVGVNGMKEGGERVVNIPAALAYGAQEIKDKTGKVIIPANSTLVFDIKLVKVQPPQAPAQSATSTNTKATSTKATTAKPKVK